MATNNQLNVGLSGASGTGSFVGNASPVLVTPILGAASATSLTFSPTTGGIVGAATNNNAAAGVVGEYISSSIVLGSAVSLTSTTAADVTSIALSAGDWDVCGSIHFSPGAGTTNTTLDLGINTTTATLPTAATENNRAQTVLAIGANQWITLSSGAVRFNVSGATTVYLVARATFLVSTMAAYGFIGARRVR